MTVLSAKNITMQFGGLTAVDQFNLELSSNELVGLIGPSMAPGKRQSLICSLGYTYPPWVNHS